MPQKKKPLPDSPLVPLIEDFCTDFEMNHSQKTVENYRYDLLKLARFDPTLDLGDIDGAAGIRNIRAFIRTVPEASRGRVISACREWTHWLVYMDKIGRDPGPFIPRPKKTPPRPDPVSDAEVEKILQAAQADPWDWLRFLIYVQLGLRKMEAGQLRLGDFKFGTLHFTRFKPRRRETLPYTETIRLAVEALYAEGAEDGYYVFHPTSVSGLPETKGKVTRHYKRQMAPNSIHGWWTRLLQRADVPHFRLHRMRHTAGSRIYHHTKDPAMTQRAMGHTDVRTTMSTYVQADDAKLISAIEQAAKEGLGR